MRDFNSIKVQLEHINETYIQIIIIFQFHKGTIRTFRNKGEEQNVLPFQFHKGTIRTTSAR